ncbi:hypothetical protein G6F46_009144 [Rhizopus delemar]|nr:hypothetical protein G6F55_001438 [Rhizopus delemar]KAG1539221.1 hypothetical protein G6F51_009272 [Rhizopus arrhizus]KAG1493430.1 hypothetical protein G6F54_008583 [Rhizopus delemar]KAG1508946.1 hypothetical protein G6F53_007814 [Rhizopus delemar]KAG1522825.1 hypothetical protein G6F52_005527 [Rhizopus delemar]
MSHNMNTLFFYEDGTGGIFDEQGQEAPSYVEDKSFRLKKLTDLRKYIKNQKVQVETRSPADTEMKEAEPKKERDLQYNVYTFEDLSQLNEAHKSHLINFFDEDSTATIQDAVEDLTAKFANLDIKKSRVAEFMKEECNLSIKVVGRHPVARNKEENLQKRADWVEKWVQNGMDYLKNCIFVDESGFGINMRRSRGWSPRGSKSITETPSTKATSHSVLGTISAIGVVNMKLRESGNLKRRKVVGATKRKAPEDQLSVPKGTIGEHYLQFISDTMDIMDGFSEMKDYFIIMDNAPIHVPEIIDPIIIQRGYIPVYLPPYSPELNLIEQFWSIIKTKVRRTKLSDIETLTARIVETSEAVPIVHLENIIQHSVNQFEKCQNKMPL